MDKTATETSPAFCILALKVSVAEWGKNKLSPESTEIKLMGMRKEGEAKKVSDHSVCILCWVLPIHSNRASPFFPM